ncbi:MAG TPA: FtsX-like permease family protein [Bacteroidales bacterium]|nr:FtsX-like permease family protein [Bacteroidales bacterium]HOK98709.1 FtsX-like permease family protein [Bacteroidales bacterium]
MPGETSGEISEERLLRLRLSCLPFFFSILMRGFQIGAWNDLIDSVLRSYTGYVQIHAKGFWENRTLDYLIPENDTNVKAIGHLNVPIQRLIPRFESFALASNTQKIKGVIVTGISPSFEKEFTHLPEKIVAGSYLDDQENAVLVSQRLARFLSLSPGDSVVLMSKGYQGSSAAGLFRVKGIVKLPSPEFDNQMIFMPLAAAQEFYSAPGLITTWIVDLNRADDMKKVTRMLGNHLPADTYEVMSWHEMLVELYQQYVSDEGGSVIMMIILYLIVGFGIFGTAMMMLTERRYELGVMIAVGMQRWKVSALLSLELFFICLIGLFAGVLLSIPFLTYYHFHPITFTGQMAEAYKAFGMEPILSVAWRIDYILNQLLNVTLIAVAVLSYPVYSIFRLNLTQALKR